MTKQTQFEDYNKTAVRILENIQLPFGLGVRVIPAGCVATVIRLIASDAAEIECKGMRWTEIFIAPAPAVKLLNRYILTGTEMPRHIQIAWGRHIFRLLHLGNETRRLWLRDLPIALTQLGREYGFTHCYRAYLSECERAHVQPEF